jgi:hypothetical protein
VIYGQNVNLDPISEKGMGFCFLIASIGRGLKGRKRGKREQDYIDFGLGMFSYWMYRSFFLNQT